MAISYSKIRQIIGPLIFLKREHDVQYGEIVKIRLENGEIRTGQVVKMNENTVIIQLYESTKGLSAENAEILFTQDTFKLKISKDMIGGTFNSLGKPIDVYSRKILNYEIVPEEEIDVNGFPINPFAREYPSEVIQTGISIIDGLFSLIRGQKLPIFSAQGLPHNRMAAQIANQAKVLTGEPFLVIFCGIGLIHDDVLFFLNQFKGGGNIQNILSFINFAEDPIMERLMVPRVALAAAEYFAFKRDMQVLIILVNITNYAEALRELSSAKEEIPSRKGYPGYLYSDLASMYERTGKIKGKKGSITQIPILTMPNDDISHPVPDTTAYITEGQLVLNRNLYKQGIYPPLEVFASISRLMKDAIGAETTREDHADISSQIISIYSNALEIRNLISIIGEEGLNFYQRAMLKFADDFENKFMKQGFNENREFSKTLDIAWDVISNVPKSQLIRIHQKFIDKYYKEKLQGE